ncbi:MAG: FAD-binding oxidoreductase [Acidimicrobiia bacterium]|jgi:glycine/D-amino acid oxidase-like deaminating enzyme
MASASSNLLTLPFWVDDRPFPPGLTSDLPDDADVIVVGSGFTGLSAARRLADAGRAVTVVDAGPIARGASCMNGGMVEPGFKLDAAGVLDSYGPVLGRELWQASTRALGLVEEIIGSERIEAHWHRSGAVLLGTHPRDAESLRAHQAFMRDELGVDMEFVTGDRLRSETVDSDVFTAGLIDPEAGGLHPAAYAFGLAGAVAGRGVRLVERCRATGVERSGAGFQVTTSHGTVRAGDVLVATNGYTDRLLPGLRHKVVSIGSYIAVTEPLDPSVAERLIPGNRMLYTARRLLNYFRRTPDDRILMGGRHNLAPDLDLRESAGFLGGRIIEIFPELARVPLTHTWGGRLGVTFDLMPHLGRIDGVWYALGYGGHGVALATYLGAEAAGRISGELTRSPFEEIGHPGRWYYRGRAWFLPFASALYRGLDAVGR